MERSPTNRRWEGDWRDLVRVRIIDETNGFGLDFVEKTESRFWSTTPDVRAVL